MATALATSSFSERLRYWLRPPRKLRFTRQGRWFVGMTLAVGFGAINTGNNLLYMLLGMMLGLIIVSGLMSEAMLRKVRIDRLPGEPIFAGKTAAVQYGLHNDKRLFPSFSIEVTENLSEESLGARRAKKKKRKKGQEIDPAVPRCLVHRVAAGRSRVGQGKVLLPRRGLYEYDSIELATRFPFGFFKKSRTLDRSGERLAFPRIVAPPAIVEGLVHPGGNEEQPQRGVGQEYHGLRDYQYGEDWRRIHWKVSARRGELIVRENQRESSKVLTIAVLHAAPQKAHASTIVAIERTIEVAAALARKYLADGFTVGLVTLDGVMRPGLGAAQLKLILRALALLEVHQGAEAPALHRIPDGPPVFLVRPPRAAAPGQTLRNATVLVVDEDGEVRLGT